MTGRDLILYILQNNLEDEPVFQDGKFIGMKSLEETAVRFNVGVATVKVWIDLGVIEGYTVKEGIYILPFDKE